MSGRFQRGAGYGRIKKPAKTPRLRIPLVALGLGAVGLLFLGVYELYAFLLTWDELTISSFEVRCPDPAVASQAEGMVGKVAWGNILLVDVDRVRTLLETSPRVAASRVRKVFPSTLRVEIAPRRPAAVIEAGAPLLIARDDVVLGPAGPDDAFRLPRFRDEGGFAADREAKLERAWACLEDLGPTLSQGVEVIDLSEPSNIVLVFRDDPTRLKLGDGLYRQRARDWLADRERLRRQYGPMEYVDLRFFGRTTFKPAAGSAGPASAAVPANPGGTPPGGVRPPGL